MLQRFKVRNYRNFRDELIFSFKTIKDYEFNKELIKDGIIKDCLVVGKNYCYEKRYENSIIREQILVNEKKILENDFTGAKVLLKGAENLDLEKWDRSISLAKYVYANTVLDKEDAGCKAFCKFMQFVNHMLWFSCTEGKQYIGFRNEMSFLFEAIADREGAAEELQAFLQDFGFFYQLSVKDSEEGKYIYCKMGEREVPWPSLVSSGTRSLILFFYWYMQIEECSFLYVDDFDAFYHTDLARAVVRKIIEIPNVQAVITSHNTDLMSNDLLRPDCIFKLEDNKIKPFSDLTDKALREAHNLQKMYKAGAFNE
ncbi:MAG: ATP-binding protein [Acetatifactor sp.]|nr:ATP-binding protein [Acetatifactor sp.]